MSSLTYDTAAGERADDRDAQVDALFAGLTHYVIARGIDVRERRMEPEKPAEFDGLSITLNPRHDRTSLCWYLAHSYGSIAGWCQDLEGTAALFHELRDAKCERDNDMPRLDRAIARFRAFEELASRYSVWTLADIGHAWAIDPFSVFFHADLEAMTIFHRDGRAPNWPEWIARWQDAVARGDRKLAPFEPLAVPDFTPAQFEKQEVKQELG
jgi:hypothetical protein